MQLGINNSKICQKSIDFPSFSSNRKNEKSELLSENRGKNVQTFDTQPYGMVIVLFWNVNLLYSRK